MLRNKSDDLIMAPIPFTRKAAVITANDSRPNERLRFNGDLFER